MNLVDKRNRTLDEAIELRPGRSVATFNIEPEKLLLASDNTRFGDSRKAAADDADSIDACLLEHGLQLDLFVITAPEACQNGMTAEAR